MADRHSLPASEDPDPKHRGMWKVFIVGFLALLLIHLWLIGNSQALPFVDLPFHLTAGTIVKNADDAGHFLAQAFTAHLFPKPNVVHLLFISNDLFPSVEAANRVYYGLYAALLPLSVLVLIRTLGGDPTFSIWSFLLLYNFSVRYGFAGFTLAIPLCLFFFSLLYSDLRNRSLLKLLALSVFLLFLFLTHAVATLYCLGFMAMVGLYHWRTPRTVALRLLLLALPTLGVFVWWGLSREINESNMSTLAMLAEYFSRDFLTFSNLKAHVRALFYDQTHLAAVPWRYPVAALFALCLLTPLALAVKRHGARIRNTLARPEAAYAGLLLLSAILCFTFLPLRFPGFWPLYSRFPVFMSLFAIVLAAVLWPTPKSSKLLAFGLLVCGLNTGLNADYFAEFDTEVTSFEKLLSPIPTGDSTLGCLVYDNHFRDLPAFIHFTDYYLIRNRGLSTTTVADFRFGPIRKSGYSLPMYLPWVAGRQKYDGRYRTLDFVAVRGQIPESDLHFFEGADPVATQGAWSLYRSAEMP